MPVINHYFLPCLLLGGLSLAACHTPEMRVTNQPVKPALNSTPASIIPVQRYGRYTLVEMQPDLAKQNLLLQVIDVDIPGAWNSTVADAMKYVLIRSGYRLCASTPENAAMFALPLPAAHIKLGPIVLRDALQVLAGSAWSMQVDEQLRQICFVSASNGVARDIPLQKTAILEISR
ncbi:PilL N-terminal domain-containing protein [Pseudomonas zeae]|uniref:PilL N-terminal domain-containing protein n=1 Tax=Pseudomonas zeae TaxID=2745510 RepID=A0A9E6NKC7_9PSED|nr:PilL N-terminal domain-containing protein [Pseudomonas zeae]QXI09132.1 PilL N-terminal domain-containing protein [Pseudomonas zeae]